MLLIKATRKYQTKSCVNSCCYVTKDTNPPIVGLPSDRKFWMPNQSKILMHENLAQNE